MKNLIARIEEKHSGGWGSLSTYYPESEIDPHKLSKWDNHEFQWRNELFQARSALRDNCLEMARKALERAADLELEWGNADHELLDLLSDLEEDVPETVRSVNLDCVSRHELLEFAQANESEPLLYAYASAKAAAMMMREQGLLQYALRLEACCEAIHGGIPKELSW